MLIKNYQIYNKPKRTKNVEDSMSKHSKNYRQNELKIRRTEATSDRLTSRAGLSLFVAYMHSIQIFNWLDRWFGSIRKSKKSIDINRIFKQGLCFFFDATCRRLTYFDLVSHDEGYASSIETPIENMASSDQMKRYRRQDCLSR